MIVAGIDSAARTGIAIVSSDGRRERLLWHAVREVHDAADIAELVAEVAERGVHLIAIESAYLGINPRTALALGERVGRWLQQIERTGGRATCVSPSIWQSGILLGLIAARSTRAVRKRAARQWARATFGVELGEDEADATGIATWAARRAVMEDRTRKAAR